MSFNDDEDSKRRFDFLLKKLNDTAVTVDDEIRLSNKTYTKKEKLQVRYFEILLVLQELKKAGNNNLHNNAYCDNASYLLLNNLCNMD